MLLQASSLQTVNRNSKTANEKKETQPSIRSIQKKKGNSVVILMKDKYVYNIHCIYKTMICNMVAHHLYVQKMPKLLLMLLQASSLQTVSSNTKTANEKKETQPSIRSIQKKKGNSVVILMKDKYVYNIHCIYKTMIRNIVASIYVHEMLHILLMLLQASSLQPVSSNTKTKKERNTVMT